MKTDFISTSLILEDGKSTPDEKTLTKTPRRSLHPLQKSAVDKENLVGAGRSTIYMTPNKGKVNVAPENKSAKKLKFSKSSDSRNITVEDLTSEGRPKQIKCNGDDDPGKEYYKTLAERRRIALEESLKENEMLHERIKQLEEENVQCNILLNETRELVETLTEMLQEVHEIDDTEETESSEMLKNDTAEQE